MSIASELLEYFPGLVDKVKVNKEATLNGEEATEVVVNLSTGLSITGTFTNHPRSGFGGVEFAGPKDIVGLMRSKIESVLNGTAWFD